MNLIPVIGLETHIQLKTRSKMFCSCPGAHAETAPPNTNVCPICLAHPGTLPVPNAQAIRFAILLGIALNGTIASHSKFDRKNYFYPDLPKGYQISQFDLPIMSNGSMTLEIASEEAPVTIGIERLHLEEDSGKNIHSEDGPAAGGGTKTFVDFNRGGMPLCEIVTRPDFQNAVQAKAYLQELRLLVRSLGVSDGDMEKAQLRCDVNISLREVLADGSLAPLNPKTEIKNINSFRAVERAIAYEIKRQTALWEAGTPPMVTTTRGWDEGTQSTQEQRIKEGMADYRYFPEPDIPPLDLKDLTDEIRRTLPELPAHRRRRFVDEYGFRMEDARQMIDDPALANFTEHVMSELGGWIEAQENIERDDVALAQRKMAKLVASWILNKLMGIMMERGIDIRTAKVSPENFAELMQMIAGNKVTGTKALEVLGKMLEDGGDPSHVVEEMGAGRLDDVTALAQIVDDVIATNAKEVERYKAGEIKLLPFFIGQVMKISRGNADPDATAQMLTEKLS